MCPHHTNSPSYHQGFLPEEVQDLKSLLTPDHEGSNELTSPLLTVSAAIRLPNPVVLSPVAKNCFIKSQCPGTTSSDSDFIG